MNKDKLRFLALGFFIAAIILAIFQLTQDSLFITKSDEVDYKQEYTSLSSKYDLLEQELHLVLSTESIDSKDSSESIQDSEESIIFIIKEGEPSSVVLENLLKEGLISDYEKAQTYLIENQKLTNIQYGAYNLTKDMGDQKVLDMITAP